MWPILYQQMLWNVIIKCYYFENIIKCEDFDFDNILIDGKSHENNFIYGISHTKLWLEQNLCILGSIKQMDWLEFMMEIDI